MEKKEYIAIDLKSFYASVECVERRLDPLTVNLVVADAKRTDKTICLAVSPSLKSYGVPSRPRLFEVEAKVREANSKRRWSAEGRRFSGASYNNLLLQSNPSLAVDYITAPPRMALYMDYSSRIYGVYLKYFAPEDIHVYSIDEVFIDATHYLKSYKTTAEKLARRVILSILEETGITATAGIGENLYLAKVAMDIVAKHIKADAHGVRIAKLDEMSYRRLLWEHRPLTDFWRVGRGYEKKLNANGMYTMGDIAAVSLENEDVLYRLFGINAELLIDHAWGYEPCTIADIKAYKPANRSLTTGQVLSSPYEYEKAKLIVREMCDLFALDILEKGLVTNQLTLTVGYDAISLKSGTDEYIGEVGIDYYGRRVPKHAHGTFNLGGYTASGKEITEGVLRLFERIVNKNLLVRRINICACNIKEEGETEKVFAEQLNFFTDCEKIKNKTEEQKLFGEREKRRMQAEIKIKRKYGKNAIVKGMNFEEGGTTLDRNMQIGGHKA